MVRQTTIHHIVAYFIFFSLHVVNVAGESNTGCFSDCAPPVNVGSTFHCNAVIKQCYSTIQWTHPTTNNDGEPVSRYTIPFFTSRMNPFRTIGCLTLPNTTTSVNFPYENISRVVLRDDIYFIINQMSSPQTLNGPTAIKIDVRSGPPNNVELGEGGEYTFTCRFKGYPTPTAEYITWMYNGTTLVHDSNRFNIVYRNMSTSLRISPVVKEDVGRYGCKVGNYIGDYDKMEGSIFNVVPRPPKVPPKGIKYIIAFGSFSLVLLLGGFVYMIRKLRVKRVTTTL